MTHLMMSLFLVLQILCKFATVYCHKRFLLLFATSSFNCKEVNTKYEIISMYENQCGLEVHFQELPSKCKIIQILH